MIVNRKAHYGAFSGLFRTDSSCLQVRDLKVGVGDMEQCFFEISRFTILSRFFVMLVLLCCKLSEQYSQTNFPIIKAFQGNKKGEKKRMAGIYNNLLHLYSAFLGTQSTLYSKWDVSSSTTNVTHPPGWCGGSHSAPERPPHTSLLVERRPSDEANQCMGMIRRP